MVKSKFLAFLLSTLLFFVLGFLAAIIGLNDKNYWVSFFIVLPPFWAYKWLKPKNDESK
jgi:hypothetical protein